MRAVSGSNPRYRFRLLMTLASQWEWIQMSEILAPKQLDTPSIVPKNRIKIGH